MVYALGPLGLLRDNNGFLGVGQEFVIAVRQLPARFIPFREMP
jgi:hypothetical protein